MTATAYWTKAGRARWTARILEVEAEKRLNADLPGFVLAMPDVELRRILTTVDALEGALRDMAEHADERGCTHGERYEALLAALEGKP